jgi:hypothetical protein
VSSLTIPWLLVLSSWLLLLTSNTWKFRSALSSRIWIVLILILLAGLILFSRESIPRLPGESSGIEIRIQSELVQVSEILEERFQRLDEDFPNLLEDLYARFKKSLDDRNINGELQSILDRFSTPHDIAILAYDGERKIYSSNWSKPVPDWVLGIAHSLALSRISMDDVKKSPVSTDFVHSALSASPSHRRILRNFFDRPHQLHSLLAFQEWEAKDRFFWSHFHDSENKVWLVFGSMSQLSFLKHLRKNLLNLGDLSTVLENISARIEQRKFPGRVENTGAENIFTLSRPLKSEKDYYLVLHANGSKIREQQDRQETLSFLLLGLLPWIAQLFATLLTRRTSRLYELLYQGFSGTGVVSVSPGLQKELSTELLLKTISGMEKVQTLEAVLELKNLTGEVSFTSKAGASGWIHFSHPKSLTSKLLLDLGLILESGGAIPCRMDSGSFQFYLASRSNQAVVKLGRELCDHLKGAGVKGSVYLCPSQIICSVQEPSSSQSMMSLTPFGVDIPDPLWVGKDRNTRDLWLDDGLKTAEENL